MAVHWGVNSCVASEAPFALEADIVRRVRVRERRQVPKHMVNELHVIKQRLCPQHVIFLSS